ncbi:solute carrier family 26 member 7 [Homo sapiens]|uniref:Isoform 2 of Anion exchange transporter n=1 Tax=Homo sapiens TaxID=9606 RepID=Q8TE54-2|nr:anion exchange transporter isoform b [Homo sapiens]AAI13867.1 Solute carrier family 26, member 7, isoform b [Homo sapiens]EAW91679.1 solute carrier family 26, member 7, isoform CRA_a [Homo sapiens]KAI2550615.1 solute carrier family 26 member 7 [Homo sapiens]KAI4011260.1 solute carrier family 26 member 7 [Homo sapiens]CAC88372.1 anion transporter [Homo sapiens]|eukprot:NP_599028.1 anion exchange transporter isoform b [Homo sapiens]
MTGAKRKKKSMLWSKMHTPQCEDIIQWCRRRLPILDWAPHYNLKENLLPDTVSGIMLAVQQVTQGLAFAVLSSVHPVFGLYGSLFPAIIYAIFGMGHHVATGTFALTSLISANAVERIVPQNMQNLTTQSNTSVLGLSDFEMQRIHVAAAVSFLGGVIQVAMFVLQLGSATFVVTEPVISAMTTGAATHVVTSQVKYLLGMKMPYISGPLGFFYIYAYVFENIKSVRLEALLLSLLSIVVLVLVKELNEQFKRKIKVVLPVDLVLIIAASFACYCTNMENTYGLEVVGHIPQGIPSPRAPPMNILSAVITEAFGVALVGYVASLALAQGSAKKFKYSIDDNQEFLAHGLSNIVSSFFFCIPSAAAMGRTAGLYSTGAKTQVACLISCIFVLIVIYAIGPLLYWLPMCVLASIIVVGLKGMLIQFRDLKKYWNVDKIDWGIWVSTYVFTICFAANVGLLFGVVCTIAIVIGRFPRAMTVSIKNMKEMEFKVKTEMDSETLQQVKIISINNPLVFLNAKKFYTDLMNMIQKENACNQPLDDISKCEQNTLLNSLSNGNCNEEASQSCPNEKCYLILDCSGFTFFDYSGVSMLVEVYMDCKGRSVDVLLAHCTASLIKAMTYYGNLDSEKPIFFESVSAAISHIHSNKASYKLLFDNLDLPTMPPL